MPIRASGHFQCKNNVAEKLAVERATDFISAYGRFRASSDYLRKVACEQCFALRWLFSACGVLS